MIAGQGKDGGSYSVVDAYSSGVLQANSAEGAAAITEAMKSEGVSPGTFNVVVEPFVDRSTSPADNGQGDGPMLPPASDPAPKKGNSTLVIIVLIAVVVIFRKRIMNMFRR